MCRLMGFNCFDKLMKTLLNPHSQINPTLMKLREENVWRCSSSILCKILQINRQQLIKIQNAVPNFPKPMRDRDTRQAVMYFDVDEIFNWYMNEFHSDF